MSVRYIQSAVVTGPTGAVGTALCRHMLRQGIKVYGTVRPDSKRTGQLPEGMRVIACDLEDMSQLPERMSEVPVDAFFHLAWSHTTGEGRNDTDAQMSNICHTIEAVRAAKKLGCKVFVGAGSQAEYGRFEGKLKPDTPAFPENGYGIAKLCAGQLSRLECEKLDMDHIWVRILSVYGPRDGMGSMISSTIRKLLTSETPALTQCEQKWDYLYSDDAAEALWLCALRGRSGAVYPLGSGRAAPLRYYVDALRDAVDPGLKLNYGAVPYSSKQVMHLEADLTALRQDTGFEPATSFEEGIKKTIEWVRASI